jgi:hypothetical protein
MLMTTSGDTRLTTNGDTRRPMTAPVMRAGLACLVGLCAILVGCAASAGGEDVAFLRGGQLWVAHADGSGARELAGSGVVSFAWSPDHHQLVVRRASGGGASAPTAGSPAAADAPGNLVAVSINGGSGLQITPDDAGVTRGDAWWNAQGNRLLYRERDTAGQGPFLYFSSQSDQPVGIARKPLSQAAAIPVLSADGARVAALDDAGNVLLGEPGKPLDIVASGALPALPGTKRPAHLLWQPHAEVLVYPVAASGGQVTLMRKDLRGGTRPLGTFVGLLDAAFTPDGAKLLVHTSDGFLLRLLDADADAPSLFSWREPDADALAWWSPDGSMLLIRDTGGLKLVDVGRKTVTDLLSAPGGETGGTISDGVRAFWIPAIGSPWSADGTRIVFASTASAAWRGSPLAKPAHGDVGLYVASVRDGAAPALIDSAADMAPSWGYLDPSTAFLAGA